MKSILIIKLIITFLHHRNRHQIDVRCFLKKRYKTPWKEKISHSFEFRYEDCRQCFDFILLGKSRQRGAASKSVDKRQGKIRQWIIFFS